MVMEPKQILLFNIFFEVYQITKKKFIAYATEIPIVIASWLKDPMNPVIFRGDIEVK